MSFSQNQCKQNIRPTQPPDFTGNHFLLGNQVTVTAFSQQPLTGNQNNTSVNQFQAQANQKPKIKGNQSNTARKQGPAKPRQHAEQSQPKRRLTKLQQNNQQRAPKKSDLKITWKNKKNNSTTSKMLFGSRKNGNQGAIDHISGLVDNKGVLPRQGTTNVVHRSLVNGREPSRVTETGQQEEFRHSASRQSPNFFDIRNIVNSGDNKETNMPLTASEMNRIIPEVIDVDDETHENNIRNPMIQLKPFSSLYGKTDITTPYVSRDDQSRENTGWVPSIRQHKDVTTVKRSKSSQGFESHNQPSTSVATTGNRPNGSARGQPDQREHVLKDSVNEVINTVATFNSNHQIIVESSTKENEASPAKMVVRRPPNTSTPQTSLKKVKAKPKLSKQSPKVQKLKNQRSFLANQNAPLSTSQSNLNQDVLVGVVALLSCHLCEHWVGSEQLKSCDCGFVCPTCFVANQVCAVCEKEPRDDAGAAQLHSRLAAVVPHQCRHRGCLHIVQPGEDHEPRCSFRPFHCYQCQQPVSMNGAIEHFRTSHSQPPLGEKNENVTINNFYLIPTTEKRVACCFVQDQHLTIMINKFDSQPTASFLIHAPLNDDNSKITVKFEFTLKLYTHPREVTFNSIGPAFVDVPMEVFNDWIGGLCTLDLIIAVKKIRKFNKVDVGSQKKKLKLSK